MSAPIAGRLAAPQITRPVLDYVSGSRETVFIPEYVVGAGDRCTTSAALKGPVAVWRPAMRLSVSATDVVGADQDAAPHALPVTRDGHSIDPRRRRCRAKRWRSGASEPPHDAGKDGDIWCQSDQRRANIYTAKAMGRERCQ